MKKRLFPIVIAGSAAVIACATAAAYTFREYRISAPASVPMPAIPDSTAKENPFDVSQLLGARSSDASDSYISGWKETAADTAGRVSLPAATDMPRITSFATRLRANRFAKGKLLLNSTSRADVSVNGKSLIRKSAADSLPQDASAELQLNPEADYDIIVDILSAPGDKSAPDFSLEFIPDEKFKDVTVSAAPLQQRRVSPATPLIGERVSGASVSPDGKYLLTRFRETVSDSETRYRASLTETATGRSVSEDVNYSSEWFPKGSALYYTKKRGDAYDVYKTEIPAMKTTLIASDIPDGDITFSPDGSRMFYYKEVKPDKESGPMHRYRTPDDRIPGDRDRSYLMCYDLNTRLTTPVTYGGATTSVSDFTADGKKMLYLSVTQRPDTYPFYFTDVIEMDLATLKTDTIIRKSDGSISNAIYSPDARRLFITASPNAFGGIGAAFAPHDIGNDFDLQGFIYDIASGKVSAMTRDFDPSIQQTPVWNRKENRIYFIGEAGFNQYVYRLDPASGKIEKLPSDLDYVRGFSIGDNEAAWLAYWGGGFTTDGKEYLLDLKGNKSRLVADPLAKTLDGIEFGKMEQWKFTASDGSVIDGYICLPPGFDASKKYPLIVYYYGGTSPSEASFRHLYSPQVFASRDYVVYVLNPSGTTGYGQEFSARHVNAWGKRTAEEIIEGTRKFCESHPFVDAKKIGCIGASYGGFMTQYLQTLTDMFAAAVSHAGISNVTSYWGEGYWGYSYNSVAAAKSYPWTDPELFTKQGSLFNADKIHTPLLLLHGTVDTNVPIGESIQLFNALKILGRDVEFITVQDENHVIAGFDNRQIWQNTIMAWFAKYLQDDPRWWNELYK